MSGGSGRAEQAADPSENASPPARRAHPGELISAGCGLLLLVALFAVQWFGVDEVPGKAGVERVTTENGWDGLVDLRWLVLLTALSAICALLVHATRGEATRVQLGAALTALGSITAGLLVVRVLIDPPGSHEVVDQKLGGVLALVLALGIPLGSHAASLAARGRARELSMDLPRRGVARRRAAR